MRNVFRTGVILAVSLMSLSGCAGNVASTSSATLNGYTVAATGAAATESASPNAGGKDFRGKHGGQGKGGMFGLPAELNLTDDQKAQLEALRSEDKPEQIDQATMEAQRTAMEAVRTEINTAFVSDTFDVTALKAKLDALRPQKANINSDERFTAEANRIVKTYNILTAEQRAILETKQQEMAAKVPAERPSASSDANRTKMEDARFDKLAAELSLTDDQKTSLKAALQPVTPTERPIDNRKVTQDAVNAELKTGTATVESIAAILKTNAPTELTPPKDSELDRLAKVYAILNSDQRKIYIESNAKGMGFGGPGGHGGPQDGGPRGHGGPGPDGEARGPRKEVQASPAA